MNVMNRKLFANRAARRRLANMGGIMTSSPELMQAAQTFQTGGQIGSPTAQKVKTVKAPYSGIMYDVYTDGRVVEANSGRTLDPTNAVQATIIRDIKALPGATNENSGIIAASPVLDKELGSTTLNMALDAIDKRQDEGRISPADANFEKIIASGRLSEFDDAPEAIDYGFERMMPPISPSEKNDESNPYQADIDAAVESYTGTDTKEVKKKVDEPTILPEIEVTGKPDETKEASIEELQTKANDPDASSDQRSSNVSTQVLTDAGFEDVGNMTTKQRVAAYQEMFKEFIGEGDEDANEEKWHNLAMIGFAIAAGQDPSALANIANGLLEGSKVMKGDRAARRKRKDSITTMAIEQVFSEKAAEKDAQLRRELAAAKGGVGARDFRSPIDAFDNALTLYTEMLKDQQFKNTVLKEAGLKPSDPKALNYLNEWVNASALKRVNTIYPRNELIPYGYAVAEKKTEDQSPESYFEANRPKNKGAVYTFDGVTYKNDEVTGKPSQISD